MDLLFDPKNGAFPAAGGRLGGMVSLKVSTIDQTKADATVVFSGPDVTVSAVGVPHNRIPAVAYRVQARKTSIVFTGDQNGSDARFLELARGADILVANLNGGHDPAAIGRVATEAGVRRLVLSHLPYRDLKPLVAEVQRSYKGSLTIGEDLQCLPIP
jgi:ribonuclease BN (tRNA processing enzyme)